MQTQSQPQSEPSALDPISHIITNTAAALSQRQGESQQQRQARARDATTMIKQFQPANVIEAMLAAHSVMFHCLMNDAARDMGTRDEAEPGSGSPSGLVALNNAFHRNLDRFERSRKVRSEQTQAAPQAIVADANKALANATAQTQTRRAPEPPAPPIRPAQPPPPPVDTQLPGLPHKLTPQQQLQAAVDGVRAGPPSIRPSDTAGVNRSGASHAAMNSTAGGATIPPASSRASSRA